MLLSDLAGAGGRLRSRILLVDDHLAVLEQVRELLQSEFEIVAVATSGMGMIDSALKCRPDVIVTDVSMPGVIDGIEAARRLRAMDFTCVVVFLSISGEAEIVSTALSTGALGYVHKTRAGTELITAILQALDGRSFVSPSLRR